MLYVPLHRAPQKTQFFVGDDRRGGAERRRGGGKKDINSPHLPARWAVLLQGRRTLLRHRFIDPVPDQVRNDSSYGKKICGKIQTFWNFL